MTFGLQILGDNGDSYLDSREKRYYTLIGRKVARKTNPFHFEFDLTYPVVAGVGVADLIVTVELPEDTAGHALHWTMSTTGLSLTWMKNARRVNNYNLQPTVYFYTNKDFELTNKDIFGLDILGEDGQISFSSSKYHPPLQISSVYSGTAKIGDYLKNIGSRDACVILNSQPSFYYQADGSDDVRGIGIYRSGGDTYTMFGIVSQLFLYIDYSNSNISATFCKTPLHSLLL